VTVLAFNTAHDNSTMEHRDMLRMKGIVPPSSEQRGSSTDFAQRLLDTIDRRPGSIS
jgi:hypothetical protein